MAEIRYGIREGSAHGKEFKCAADQYFHNRGGKFVYLNASGHAALCVADADKVGGWAETPKQADGYSAWKSSSTAGSDKLFVMTGMDTIFELPADESIASLAESFRGRNVGIVTSGSTYSMVQKALLATSVASPLTVVDYDSTNKTVMVKIDPDNKQAI